MEKFKFETPNLTKQNIEKIEKIFPNCITEDIDENGKPKKAINFDILRQMLSDEIVEGDEAYEFSWVGKKNAMLEANKPIRKTLRPCKEESVNWENTENLYIEGDNLEVLKLLQESYLGTVKMIYIDPPYNTGNDSFIYSDNFSMDSDEYLEASGQVDENGTRLFKENSESNPRFHSNWCSMMYSRLLLARNLLSDDGVIFISIDDHELDNLKKICSEVFGESNLISIIAVELSKTQGMKVLSAQNGQIVKNHEYVYVYAKMIDKNQGRLPLYEKADSWDSHFNCVLEINNNKIKKYNLNEYIRQKNPEIFELIKQFDTDSKKDINADLIGKSISLNPVVKSYFYNHMADYIYQEMDCSIALPIQVKNKLNEEKFLKYDKYILTISSGGKIRQMRPLRENLHKSDEYFSELCRTTIRGALWKGFYSDMMNITKEGNIIFKNGKKPVRMIKQLFKWANRKDSIILDFFSGSATTAHAVMKLNAEDGGNRKFMIVQFPEPCKEDSEAYKAGYKNICEIGKERIRRAAKKIKEENPNAKFDGGFRVFKVADSNMNEVFYSAGEYSQGLLTKAEDNIKSDRTDMDLLYGCLLDWGVPISMRHKEETVNGFKIHIYGNGEIIDLIACFEENISEALIKEIARKQPLKAVFRDSCFANSPSKINAEEIFKLISPDTRIKVI